MAPGIMIRNTRVTTHSITVPSVCETLAPHLCLMGMSEALMNLLMMEPTRARNTRSSGMPMMA